MVATNWLVCYDVSEDETRFAVADCCKAAGLVRIQYSVFYGMLERSQLNSLRLELKQTIAGANADVHLIRVCASCESEHEVLTSLNLDGTEVTTENSYEEISEELDAYNGVLIL